MLKLTEIEGNNLEQAIAYYKQCREQGTWNAQRSHALLHLQDNPDALIEAIAHLQESSGANESEELPPPPGASSVL